MSDVSCAADASERPLRLSVRKDLLALLSRHGVQPRKRLGQNFLTDGRVLERIVRTAELSPSDQVLEIGAGAGTVTRELARVSPRVLAVEIDGRLRPVLDETLGDLPNVQVVIADVLALDLPALLSDGQWKVVANLPYYVTTPILTRLIELIEHFPLIVVMVQREVADRLTASPGGKDYGSLSVFTQWHCEVAPILHLSPHCFFPEPEVASTLVTLCRRQSPPVSVQDQAHLFRVVRAAFGQRRKTLLNALVGSPDLGVSKEQALAALRAAGIDPGRRGESLSLTEFAALSNTFP